MSLQKLPELSRTIVRSPGDNFPPEKIPRILPYSFPHVIPPWHFTIPPPENFPGVTPSWGGGGTTRRVQKQNPSSCMTKKVRNSVGSAAGGPRSNFFKERSTNGAQKAEDHGAKKSVPLHTILRNPSGIGAAMSRGPVSHQLVQIIGGLADLGAGFLPWSLRLPPEHSGAGRGRGGGADVCDGDEAPFLGYAPPPRLN